MDSFEQIVSEILWMSGWWVRTSVKVQLTPEEKKQIGRVTSPRWELDIVAYQGDRNVLKVVECKSFLDSTGVKFGAFNGRDPKSANRYKLFTNAELRSVVFKRLCLQLVESGACKANPKVELALACGHVARGSHREDLHAHFKSQGWDLWDEKWLRKHLEKMATGGYENQVSAVVAKILLR